MPTARSLAPVLLSRDAESPGDHANMLHDRAALALTPFFLLC